MRGSAVALRRRVDPRITAIFSRRRLVSLLSFTALVLTLLVLFNRPISSTGFSTVNSPPEGLSRPESASRTPRTYGTEGGSDTRGRNSFQPEFEDQAAAAIAEEPSEDSDSEGETALEYGAPITIPERPTSPQSIPPFLPFSCPATRSSPALSPSVPRERTTRWGEPIPGQDALLLEPLVGRSVEFRGSGSEVKRVLRRAVKSSLYGRERKREGRVGTEGEAEEDERIFRILVLGGSVSNCRAVDTEGCWHSYLLRWFQDSLPLEHDPTPPLSTPRIPINRLAKRADRLPSSDKSPPHRQSRKAQKKPPTKRPTNRGRIITRLINSAKSATGSAFFAYCFEQEMKFRRKSAEWGTGPDLVVLEFGVNDVWPADLTAQKDFERLLYSLRGMESGPAIIILEATSLFLKDTEGRSSAVEMHLPAALAQDVVILSAAKAIFDEPDLLSHSTTSIPELFLVDLHHPNLLGHFLLGQIVTDYLEGIACEIQSEVISRAERRLEIEGGGGGRRREIDVGLDVGRRSEEVVLAFPETSCFGGLDALSKDALSAPTTCLQIGLTGSGVRPVDNVGWANYVYSRDKQYLIAEEPGSTITFDLLVREGGEIIVYWLRSQFYSLGDVLVYVDDDESTGIQIAGYWDLGWSIGVPTTIFSNVSPGSHRVTFRLLPSSLSSNPKGKSSGKVAFRLIGLIAT